MAPARYGLGLALGLMATLFLTIMCLEARAQAPGVLSGPAVTALNQTLIEGTVRSASTNMPIEGAKVRLSHSDTIVFTDADGTFSIATARKEGEVEASFAGYMPVRKPFDETGIGASASTFRLPTDVTTVDKLLLGDTIPVSLWDLPLTVVNHPKGRHTVTLREYQDRKLIVLDFWARWCSPCVKSVDHWGQAQTEFPDELAVITVHVDFPDRALPFMQNRGWQVPAVIGVPGDYLNAYFHHARQVGSVIWIYQGRFYAAPKDKKYPIAELRKLLNGDPISDIPSTATYLHTTK
ncbi:hypothetical protein GCM10011386_03010 [Parapedobacter defluvii]|uniref:Thioredoxin domain-containing protein n=2 Tax=Parapedobacter defluvii TaxID=2045106 RepID=A0ABQ1L1K0_9SPHI|nr:hypothetical protein GCM10011386_03010 [Parapedobacter defluvii]